jgi:hypothetical protein
VDASHHQPRRTALTRWLEHAPAPVFVGFAILAAFTTYFAMYAFRKPFAAARFDGQVFLDTRLALGSWSFALQLELKTAIVISQILGYCASKYLGIRVCSELSPARRAMALLLLIGWAQSALVLYGLLPDSWKVLAIFLNGLPLGMVWGLVVGYLEGRRTSEILLAGLSLSFIIASGITKDFGRALMEGTAAELWTRVPLVGSWIGGTLGKVSEGWMPSVAGLHFLPVFGLAVWLLNQLPRPDAADVLARVEREPMGREERFAFIRQFGPGLALLCIAYFFLTAYRDYRDNYQVEIFDGLGYAYADNKTIISKAESIVMLGVLGVLALLNLVKDNRHGLMAAFGVMTFGVVLLGASCLLLKSGVLSGFWFMTLTGLGSYLAYVPYGSVLFDRLIASTRVVGTAVFAIYLADAIGYTGSVGVQLYKDLLASSLSRLGFFIGFTGFLSVLGAVCLLASAVYFWRQTRPAPSSPAQTP